MAGSGSGAAAEQSSARPDAQPQKLVYTQKEKLREILGAARPSWGQKDLAAAENKLREVGATSLFMLKSLLDQPPESGLNRRLREAGLKVFGLETLAAIREQLAQPGMAPYLRKPREATDIPTNITDDQQLAPPGAAAKAAGEKAAERAGSEQLQEPAQEPAEVPAPPEAEAAGDPEEWSVVHTRVIVRETPSTSGKVAGLMQRGQIVKGIVEDVGGTKWLRVRAGDIEGDPVGRNGLMQWEILRNDLPVRESKDVSSLTLGSKAKGVLVFGRQEGEWVALHPEKGYMQISVGGQTLLKAAADRPLWMLIDGQSLGLGQLLMPTALADSGAGLDEVVPPVPPAEKRTRHLEELLKKSNLEVRSVPGRGLGVFATRKFSAGEVVLEERPFWTRPQPEEVKKYKELFKPDWAEAFTAIKESIKYPGEDAEAKIYASPAMVRNALGYGLASPAVRRKILHMHSPDLDCGHPIVTVAGRVAALCIEHLKECKDVDQVELQRAILAAEMNIFAGGRCFSTFCRLNHSCFPNAVYIAMKHKWCFKALRDINEGEEVLHSYLGKELLLPTEIRRRLLWRSKCFECACERCTAPADTMRALPCRWCSLEEASLTVVFSPGIYIREEPTRYATKKGFVSKGNSLKVAGSSTSTDWVSGDWVKVHHPDKGEGWVLTHGRSLEPPLNVLVVDSRESGSLISDGPAEKQSSSYWSAIVDFLASSDKLAAATMMDEENRDDHVELLSETVSDGLWLPAHAYAVGENAPPIVTFQEGSWRCERCQRGPGQEDMLLATERLAGRLTECTFFSPEMTPALGAFSGKHGGLKMVKQTFVQKAMDLAITVTGVLGRRHWCYHWAQILFVDLIITRIQYAIGQKIDAGAYYLLEMLDDLWEWLSSLGMAQDPGCFLYGRISEAVRRIAHMEREMDDLSRWRYRKLKERVENSNAQVEILPLRPLIIDGTVSFQ